MSESAPSITVNGIPIYGVPVDEATRCEHWHSPLDIIAIKFPCCGRYYPCFSCHEVAADHAPVRWSQSRYDDMAILCGACGLEMSIRTYFGCESQCPRCAAAFNPKCAKHYHLYFEEPEGPSR